MSDDHDRDVQAWFDRSVDGAPAQPFTLAVMTQVRRNARHMQLQYCAALLVAFTSFCLLLPELIAPLNRLAALPSALTDAGAAQWPVLVVIAMGLAYWLRNRAGAHARLF
jgi:hypothetical protein